MGWFHRGQKSNNSQRADLRLRQGFEHSPAIRLEDRLVLGSLSPLPGIPPICPPEPGGSNAQPLPESETSSTSLTPTNSSDEGQQDDEPSESTQQVGPDGSQEETIQLLSSETSSGSILGSSLEDPATTLPPESESSSSDAPGSGVESLQNSQAPAVSPDVDSQQQSPQSQTDSTSDDGSGDSLVETLQNRNPGVLVDSEALENGYSWSTPQIPWFDQTSEPVVIQYDFRDQNGTANEMTQAQIEVAEQALQAWTEATNGRVTWVRNTEAPDSQIVNIGLGNLSAVSLTSNQGGTLGVSGTALTMVDGAQTVMGTIWLDHQESWENTIGNGDVDGTIDLYTAVAHEAGHIIGLDDHRSDPNGLMYSGYTGEKSAQDVASALTNAVFFPLTEATEEGITGYALHCLAADADQLTQAEVTQLLNRASAASSSQDAIIAVVDRNGSILGVRVEQGVLNQFAGNQEGLIFAIDGAIAKARTAAFFANDQAPLTSRTIQALSQSTITQREVEGNPNASVVDPTLQGPGYVAPIGLGAHFPAGIRNTPPVDLFGIEHSNRDNTINAGTDGMIGTADDIGRFNIDPTLIPAGQNLVAPISYGALVNPANADNYRSRGVATLPGGIPIFRDTDDNGTFDKLIGGIGVFFPGEDGYATHEQGFIPGINQTITQRVNTDRTQEAEFMALAAVGGSPQAVKAGAGGAVIGEIAGIPPVDDIGLPFGNITLVGIQLPVVGDIAGVQGVRNLVAFARQNITTGAVSGTLNPGVVVPLTEGQDVPVGDLVIPHGDGTPGGLTTTDVQQIIDNAIAAADVTRAAIRINTANNQAGVPAKMVISITDLEGNVLGLYRMEDATVFSIDVAVAKARNVAYYASSDLQAIDQLDGVAVGTAFTNRTFRFVAEPRFPDGVDGSTPPQMSILSDAAAAGIDPATGENIGAPAAASVFQSALGYDSFNPETNFRDPTDPANQNGVIFFPGSTPLYKNGVLVGGLGISGDGVDQDDIVTFLAAQGFLPDGVTTQRADQVFVNGVRLPYQKFNRVPFALGS